MSDKPNIELIIKNGRWLTSGLIAGAIIGVIAGIAVTRITPGQNETTIEQSKLSAQTLGWDSLDKITAASKAFDTKNDVKLARNLEMALTQAYAMLGRPQPKTAAVEKPTLITASTTQAPKIEKSNQTVATNNPVPKTQIKVENTDMYADGTGETDINTATLQQIDDVPRMSTTTAKDIYDFIHQKGPIKSFSELDSIKNVGEKTLEKLRSLFHIKK